MHIKKQIASLGAAVFLCLNFSVVSYADTVTSFENDGISLAYEIANSCTSDLEIVSEKAHCKSIAEGIDAVSITITQTLQKYLDLWVWNDVEEAEWTKTQRDNSVCLSTTIGNLSEGTYRLKSIFTLTNKNGKKETITMR